MLSHSLGSNLHMWDPQMAVLEAKHRVLRYDTRGHGASDAPRALYTSTSWSRMSCAALDALKSEK